MHVRQITKSLALIDETFFMPGSCREKYFGATASESSSRPPRHTLDSVSTQLSAKKSVQVLVDVNAKYHKIRLYFMRCWGTQNGPASVRCHHDASRT